MSDLQKRVEELEGIVSRLVDQLAKVAVTVSTLVSYIDSHKSIAPEDYDDMVEEAICCQEGNIVRYIEQVNFHPDYPQNYNVYIADKSRHKGQIYEDGRWVTRDSRVLCKEIVQDVNNKLKSWVDQKPKKRQRMYQDYLDLIAEEGGKEKFNNASMAEVADLLYSNRDMVKPRKR